MRFHHGRRAALLAAAAILLFLAGCVSGPRATVAPPPPAVSAEASTAPRAGILPNVRKGPPALYPDPARTPGLTNPDITQANIAANICSKTWSTDTVRPPSSLTTKLKKQQMLDLHLAGTASDYEEDHLISLEVGGNPRDPRNLWPEPWHQLVAGIDLGARAKDKVENYVHDEVCFNVPNHKVSSDKAHPATAPVTLARGQQILSSDWYACYLQYQAKQPCK